MNATPSEVEPASKLDRRYLIEICFPDPGEPECWDAVASFHTPMEALRRCSDCLESIKYLLHESATVPDHDFVRLRVQDNGTGDLVLWEEPAGTLQVAPEFFEGLQNGERKTESGNSAP